MPLSAAHASAARSLWERAHGFEPRSNPRHRGEPKDQQRAVFQPVGVATFAMSAIWLGGQGSVSREAIWLFVLGLPVLLAGTWAGFKLYGLLDEAQFRKVVLILLLASGVALLLR